LSGPIIKKHLWFAADYSPEIFSQNKTLFCANVGNGDPNCSPGRSDTYTFYQRQEKTRGRLDSQLGSKLHLTATYNWQPIIHHGRNPIPSFAFEQAVLPKEPVQTNPRNGADFYNSTGGRQNSQSFSSQAIYLITDKLIVTGRYGHYFLNTKNNSYGFGDPTIAQVKCGTTGQIPPGFGCTRNQTNGITPTANTAYDATTRDIYEGDATYNFTGGGRHELKGGYGRNAISNKVKLGSNDTILLKFGVPFSQNSMHNELLPYVTPGSLGSGQLSTFSTRGDVSSSNDAIYVQDKWQPTNRLTINAGLRFEKEDVPSFTPGLPGMKFDWSSKVAPRIGAAYALTSDNKTKISGFFGIYYDRFKLNLPRGSFGGDEFHSIWFEIFPGDHFSDFTRAFIIGDGAPIPGGSCPAQFPPIYGRVRCDQDNRVSSNSGGPLTEVGGIDPRIKPFSQREITFTFQREMYNNIFSARYTRKQVLHAIEDAGFPNSHASEYYIIGNPGEGLYKEQADMFGTLAPKPQRQYDALELRLSRYTSRWLYDVNYTFSRLYGNYGGLSSSDEEGRSDPNTERYFDQPEAGFTVAGGPDNGRLPTDRPHVFKASGAYRLDWDRFGLWKNNSTQVGFFGFIESGTVITSFVSVNSIEQIILSKRGDQGRTPVLSQIDMVAHHYIKFGKDSRFTLALDADIQNLFNQHIVTNKGLNPSGQGGNRIETVGFSVVDPAFHLVSQADTDRCNANAMTRQQCLLIAGYRTFQRNGSPEMLAAAIAPENRNVYYNFPYQWQGKRQVRYGIRFLF
jgi:hypothetical protein